MYLLEIDRAQNRIHMMLSKRFDEPQAQALLDELRVRFKELETGFQVLCDLTTLEEFEPSAALCFRGVMDLCNEGGVSKVVRIIPDPRHDFGLSMMSHFHYDNGIPVIACENLDAALKHLK
jgi:hypothetical protein